MFNKTYLEKSLVADYGKWLNNEVVIDLEDRVDNNEALLGPTHLNIDTNDSVIRDVLSHVINQLGVVYKEEIAGDLAIDLND